VKEKQKETMPQKALKKKKGGAREKSPYFILAVVKG